jgi:hypothetical protein
MKRRREKRNLDRSPDAPSCYANSDRDLRAMTRSRMRTDHLITAAALAVFAGGCAGVPHRLAPETVAQARGTRVSSFTPQPRITIKWLQSGYAAAGGIPMAIIGRSANKNRKKKAEEIVWPLLAQTSDVDFQGRYTAALADVVRDVPFLRAGQITRYDVALPAVTAADVRDGNVLRVGTDYYLSPDAIVLVVSSGIGFVAAGHPERAAAVMDTLYRSEAIGHAEDERAVEIWAANGARYYRGALAEGATENLKMTRMALEHMAGTDYAGPRVRLRAQIEHGRGDFGIKLDATTLEGTIVEETAQRIVVQTEGAFYSLPKTAISERTELGRSPGVAWRGGPPRAAIVFAPPAPAVVPPFVPAPAPAPAGAPSPAPVATPAPPVVAHSPAAEPAAAPSPGLVPASGTEAPACAPPCRAGYYCNAGLCDQICNPVCPAGHECTAAAQCVPLAPAYTAAPYPPYAAAPYSAGPPHVTDDQSIAARYAKRQEQTRLRDEARVERAAARRIPRLVIGLGGGMRGLVINNDANEDVLFQHGGVRAGLSLQPLDKLGLHLTGAFVGGQAQLRSTDTEMTEAIDKTSLYGFEVDAALRVGPLWRFYLGPSVTATYLGGGKDALQSTENTHRFNRTPLTFGLDAGVVLGSRDQYDLGLRMGITNETYPVVLLWFGYQILLGEPRR